MDQMIFPPDVRRSPGRPPSIHIGGTMDGEREDHRQNRCSKCKKLGHNKARCPNQPSTSSSIGLVYVCYSYIYTIDSELLGLVCVRFIYNFSCLLCMVYTNILFIFELYSGLRLGDMNPGPVNSDVLYLQAEHQSAHIDLSRVSFYMHYIKYYIVSFSAHAYILHMNIIFYSHSFICKSAGSWDYEVFGSFTVTKALGTY